MREITPKAVGKLRSEARRNLLLGSLPEPVIERVVQHLEPVTMPARTVLSSQHGEIDRFYFILTGVASMIYTTQDGHTTEVSIIGHEGAVGLSLVLGRGTSPTQALMQVDGTALAMAPEDLLREFARGAAMQRALLRFAQALMTQIGQTVVCNRHHSVGSQLCRWILLSLDRLDSLELGMTQESIAQMLGVRRAGVTEAANRLQAKGLIRYRRGQITVTDRPGLEAEACECYHVVAREYDALGRSLAESSAEDHKA